MPISIGLRKYLIEMKILADKRYDLGFHSFNISLKFSKRSDQQFKKDENI